MRCSLLLIEMLRVITTVNVTVSSLRMCGILVRRSVTLEDESGGRGQGQGRLWETQDMRHAVCKQAVAHHISGSTRLPKAVAHCMRNVG